MKISLSRRTFLHASGVTLALPLLDAMAASVLKASENVTGPAASGRRIVAINVTLGIYPPLFFPTKAGRDYELTPHLEILREHRHDFTVYSGMSHPEVDGGHSAEASFLTAAPHPRAITFKNSISMDQVLADKMIGVTRLPYLSLANIGKGLSWTRSGVAIPPQSSPARLFEQLFVSGRDDDVKVQRERLRRGQSILDRVIDQTRQLQQEVGARDREKLEEYFSSIRQVEQRLQAAKSWVDKPKPTVQVPPLQDNTVNGDIVGKSRLMYDLAHLVLQTDSSRVITIAVNCGGRPPIAGVSEEHHNLTHHGGDPSRIAQLKLIEAEQIRAFRDFLAKLTGSKEDGGTLLDKTMVLYGSSIGNASNHHTTNLPIILAGGGFRHGQHRMFDTKNNTPLCNLFVTMMQHMGMEIDRFASSTGTVSLG